MSYAIGIIGAGNVAWHLAHALHKTGCEIKYIYGKSEHRFSLFSPTLQSICSTQRISVRPDLADFCLLCVNDDAISEVSEWLPRTSAIVAHTSGATSINTLKKHSKRGVFYPLQSFKAGKACHWQQVPFCISGGSEAVSNQLAMLAKLLSPQVHQITDLQRQQLHLAAVFANNFGNHMLALAQQICEQNKVPFDLLKPLIAETFERLKMQSPRQSQTGPALLASDEVGEFKLALSAPKDMPVGVYRGAILIYGAADGVIPLEVKVAQARRAAAKSTAKPRAKAAKKTATRSGAKNAR